MKTIKKILLKENKEAADSLIAQKQKAYSNGQNLLSLLAKIGIDKTAVTEWNIVEEEMKKAFPDATAEFNAQSKGLENEYNEARIFFNSNKHNFSFEALTDEEIESIREQYRIYASSEKQIEAYELVNSVVKDLNRLNELGITINSFYASNLSPIMVKGSGNIIEVYSRNLGDAVQSLR